MNQMQPRYQNEEQFSDDSFRGSLRQPRDSEYGRLSKISAIPQMDPPGVKRTTSYRSEQSPMQVNNYRMTERESIRSTNNDRPSISGRESIRNTRGTNQRVLAQASAGKSKFGNNSSPDRALANRATSYSSAHKRRTNAEPTNRGTMSQFLIDDSY